MKTSYLLLLTIVCTLFSLQSYSQLKIIENGNVGINNDQPSYKFDVLGNAGSNTRFLSASNESLISYLGSTYKKWVTNTSDEFGYHGTEFFATYNGGTEGLRLKNDGTFNVNGILNASGGNLTGELSGTTASFSGNVSVGANAYLYTFGRHGNSSGGTILGNNGTGTNFTLGEYADNIYAIWGGQWGVPITNPVFSFNTSTGFMGVNGYTADPANGDNKLAVGGGIFASGELTGYNLSGTNTGDETQSSIKTKLGITTLSGSNTGDQDLSGLAPINSPTFSGTVSGSTASFSGNLSIGANAYLYTYGRHGNTTGGTILANNGTANNFILAECTDNVYGISGGTWGVPMTDPKIAINTSTGFVGLGGYMADPATGNILGVNGNGYFNGSVTATTGKFSSIGSSAGTYLLGVTSDGSLTTNVSQLIGGSSNPSLLRINTTSDLGAGANDKLIVNGGGFFNGDLTSADVYASTVYASTSLRSEYNIESHYGDVRAIGGYFDEIYTLSDKNIKSNIADIPSLTDKLFRLRPVSYNLLMETKLPGDKVSKTVENSRQHMGFIAQEVKEIFPDLVAENKDGKLGINYTELMPALVQALKEQNEKIKNLEDRVVKLENTGK